MYELKCSCGSVYNGETKKKIISRLIEHKQESIKGNGHSLEQLNTKRNATDIWTGYTPKNRYYDRKLRESLETDMAVVSCGQDKVLNRDNGNFVKTNAWKPLFKEMKTVH